MKWFLHVLVFLLPSVAFANFNDVPTEHLYVDAITFVHDTGIVEGYADGTFKPDTTINRVEFLKILLEATDATVHTCQFGSDLYTDTQDGAWYMEYVYIATCDDIVEGYPDGSFGPDASINFAEASKIITNTYALVLPQYFVAPEHWYTPYIDALNSAGGSPREGITPQDLLTRGEMAMIIFMLKQPESIRQMADTYLKSYTLIDEIYGTETTVTVTDTERQITTNALPNHETGAFPTEGNPNTISAQDISYLFPVSGTYTGSPIQTVEPGVAINGVKFEPGTAERATCDSGEEYRVEAFQDVLNLGLDFNNAHVQPTGAYHYHGVPEGIVATENTALIHVGFARDGYLMYYSPSGEYTPSYRLSTETRSGTRCDYSIPNSPQDQTIAGRTFVSDWVYDASVGNLDECNGTEINGIYAYMVTQEYPYISRCLMGEFTPARRGGGGSRGSNERPPFGSAPPRR